MRIGLPRRLTAGNTRITRLLNIMYTAGNGDVENQEIKENQGC